MEGDSRGSDPDGPSGRPAADSVARRLLLLPSAPVGRGLGDHLLVCPRCGSELKIVALITDPVQVRKILHHLLEIAREPPGLEAASRNRAKPLSRCRSYIQSRSTLTPSLPYGASGASCGLLRFRFETQEPLPISACRRYQSANARYLVNTTLSPIALACINEQRFSQLHELEIPILPTTVLFSASDPSNQVGAGLFLLSRRKNLPNDLSLCCLYCFLMESFYTLSVLFLVVSRPSMIKISRFQDLESSLRQ